MTLPVYQVLSDEQVLNIHELTLDILENTGFSVPHKDALDILAQAGATVDFDTQRVCFPGTVVESALKKMPKAFVCGGRDPEFDFRVAFDAPPVCRSTGGAVNLMDFTVNENRPVTLQDCREIAHIIDGLSHTAFAATQTPCDAPLAVYDIAVFKAMLESGRKHIWALVSSAENLRFQIEMMLAVAGSGKALRERPVSHGIVTVLAPFHFPEEEIDRLLLYGEYNIPVKVPVVPMMGTNAPTTITGALVQSNAEAVGSAVLIHLLCPGTPTWYYFFIQAMDKRTGGNIFMSPEIMLCSLGLIQMARYYRLPAAPSSFETTGGRLEDILFTNGMSVSLFALAGAFENASTGCVDMSMGISKQGLVIGDDIWGHTLRLLDGFNAEPGAFALDAIKRVSTGPGHYLTDAHTRQYLRKENQYVPDLFRYRTFNTWSQDPKTLAREAQDRVDHLLKYHTVPPLEPGLQKELDRIAAAAAKKKRG